MSGKALILKYIKIMKNTIACEVKTNNSISEEVVLINNKRLIRIAIVAVLVNFANIVLFASQLAIAESQKIIWLWGIIAIHSLMLPIIGFLGVVAYSLRKATKVTFIIRMINNSAVLLFLLAGALLTAVDQLVGTNITAFLSVCIAIGLVFVIRPGRAIVAYLSAYFIFYYALGVTQRDHAVLLANRVQGISAIAIGITMIFILWKNNAKNILQNNFIAVQQLELAEKNKELEELAFHDSMTMLYNRRGLNEIIKQELAIMSRYRNKACIIILDIDNLKVINDKHGHPMGDAVIEQVAACLQENTRAADMVARWGGDEFLILLPHTVLLDASLIAKKLRKIIENKIIIIADKEVAITASFGVAELVNDSEDALELAYKNADKALYLAKEKGRNIVETI